jgi:diguanylate cyclase (GGDEF)-like protein/PAS domain S-box-containing protein
MQTTVAVQTNDHFLALLAFAAVVGWLASLGTISLFRLARTSPHASATAWLLIGGSAAGIGAWATDLISDLPYLSGLSIQYHPALVTLSLLVGIGAMTAGLWVAAKGTESWRAPVGGAILGAGVGAMHYLSVWALELPARVTVSPGLAAISVALALLLGMATLTLAARLNDRRGLFAATTVLALGVVAHQFIGMAAVEIVPDPMRTLGAYSVSHLSLAFGTGGAAITMLLFCLVGAFADRSHQDKIEEQNLLLNDAIGFMAQGLCMFDGDGRLVLWNERFAEIYAVRDRLQIGFTLRDLLRQRQEAGTLGEDGDEFARQANAAARAGQMFRHVFELPDGRSIAVSNEPRPAGGWVSTHEDITALKQREASVRLLFESNPVPMWVYEPGSLRFLAVNDAAVEHYGYSRAQFLGMTLLDIRPAEDRAAVSQLINEEDHHHSNRPSRHIKADGTQIEVAIFARTLPYEGRPAGICAIVDLTERNRAEAQIAHMARHDSLTDLPNRTAFNECLAARLDTAAAAKESFALLCIDLDRFKEINDVFGHGVGDELLRRVSARLLPACEGGFLARLGGDEFSVISAAGPQPAGAEAVSERLYAAMADDIEIEGHQLRAGLTIGISIYPDDGTDATSLLAHADAALYRAKAEARGSIRFFEPDMDRRLREKRALQHDLRLAIGRNELGLHYQPQALIGGEITGFEALARWHHPSRGLVPPNVFIPLAEESGLIIALGEWTLWEACREAASWPKPLNIAINLSPVQFQHGDLAGLVHSVLLETGLKPSRLELEITEGVLISDFSRAVSILRRLKTLGVRIAMDDFGTGYSSLSYLQAFPFDKIKIDQAFIANLERSPQSGAIIRAVIGLGRGLGLPITAEGVETQAQLDFLTRESCQEIQGFLIGRPEPIASYADMIGRPETPQLEALAS